MHMKHDPWIVRSSKTTFRNPYFSVEEQHVTRSNGTEGTYYIVDRGGPFSIVIPLFPDRTTLLVGQYRPASKLYSWEFPMGYVADVDPLTMAKQELKEETGYEAEHWKLIGRYFIGQGHTNQEAFVYRATSLTPGNAQPEEGELLEVKRVPVDEVKRLIQQGIIKDGPTIAAHSMMLLRLDT